MKRLLFLLFIPLITFMGTPQARSFELVFETDKRLPIVHLEVGIRVGAIADPKTAQGLTRFLGEMLLTGTRKKTKAQLDSTLDTLGSHLEIEARSESLTLNGAVISDQLDAFLELLFEIITQPRFYPSEIQKLKQKTISQLLQAMDDDGTIAFQKFEQFYFGNHPYSHVIPGLIGHVKNFTLEQVQSQYERLFVDDLLIVSGTGNTDEDMIQKFAKRLAKARPGKSPIRPVEAFNPPLQKRILIVDKPNRSQTQIFAGQKGIQLSDPDYFALHIANEALGGSALESRLGEEIRVKRGWSYGVASFFRFGSQARTWQFNIFPNVANTPPALKLSMELISKLKNEGLTSQEFEKTKKSIVSNALFLNESPTRRVENQMTEKILKLPKGFFEDFPKFVQRVTLEETNQAIKKFFDPEHFTIVVLGTATTLKKSLGEELQIPEKDIQVKPYTSD